MLCENWGVVTEVQISKLCVKEHFRKLKCGDRTAGLLYTKGWTRNRNPLVNAHTYIQRERETVNTTQRIEQKTVSYIQHFFVVGRFFFFGTFFVRTSDFVLDIMAPLYLALEIRDPWQTRFQKIK